MPEVYGVFINNCCVTSLLYRKLCTFFHCCGLLRSHYWLWRFFPGVNPDHPLRIRVHCVCQRLHPHSPSWVWFSSADKNSKGGWARSLYREYSYWILSQLFWICMGNLWTRSAMPVAKWSICKSGHKGRIPAVAWHKSENVHNWSAKLGVWSFRKDLVCSFDGRTQAVEYHNGQEVHSTERQQSNYQPRLLWTVEMYLKHEAHLQY